DCELASMLTEMRTLLALPRVASVSTDIWTLSAWKILRADQVFRIHEKEAVMRLLQLSYELDALVALADTTRMHDFVIPQIDTGPLAVYAEALVHPLVEHPVANPVALDQ